MLPLSVLAAVAIVAVAFPFQTLWRQQQALDAAAAQITQLHRQSSVLTAQAKSVATESAAIAMAREDYQLVMPGQRLIQVLPGDSSGAVSASSVDPGSQPLVNIGDGVVPGTSGATHVASPSRGLAGFAARFVRTLEFWR